MFLKSITVFFLKWQSEKDFQKALWSFSKKSKKLKKTSKNVTLLFEKKWKTVFKQQKDYDCFFKKVQS